MNSLWSVTLATLAKDIRLEWRSKDALKLLWDCISSVAAFCADRLVLMTITNSFRESPPEGAFDFHDIHVAGMPLNGRHAVVPCQLLEAADRLSCDTTLIGAIAGDLNFSLKKFVFSMKKKFQEHQDFLKPKIT